MKKTLLLFTFLVCCLFSKALNITIIESQSMMSGHNMDDRWYTTATSMGHTATIVPQTTLDNNAFFATTDILIVSSGTITLPANRVTTILQFIQSGKPVYIQSEYDPTFYTSNQAFAYIVNTLGGSFNWIGTVSGDLHPMNVLGTYATTNNAVTPLTYFWYSAAGSGDCNTINILEYGGQYHGFQYVPVNPAYGSILTTADQDWVRTYTANDAALMANFITHLISPPAGGSVVQVNIGNDTTLCNGGSLLLNATTPGGIYQWQDNSTNATYTVSQPGTYYVHVTVGPCSGIDTIHVNYFQPQQANIGNDTSICAGTTLLLNATTANASYLWQDNSSNATFNVSQAGIYWVDVNAGGCTTRDSITINLAPPPVFDLGNDTSICAGSVLLLDATIANGSYHWQDNSTGSTYNATQQGLYWVDVNVNGCTARDSIMITLLPSPVFDLGNDTSICVSSTLILDASTANASYLWQNSTTNATLNITQSGIYWVDVTVNGCTARDSITVNMAPVLVVDLGSDTSICQGSYLVLNAGNAGAGYLWQDASTGPTMNVYQQGLYWVIVNNSGCIGSDSINVAIKPRPSVNLGGDLLLCENSSQLLDVTTPGATYLWQDGSNEATFNVTVPGTYSVIVNLNGCTRMDSISVTLSDCNILLYIPSIFSPNDDGQNDVLYVRGDGITDIDFIIYDRWGERIFETKDISIGWDGTFRGKTCDIGVYTYYVKAKFVDDSVQKRKGTITLIR